MKKERFPGATYHRFLTDQDNDNNPGQNNDNNPGQNNNSDLGQNTNNDPPPPQGEPHPGPEWRMKYDAINQRPFYVSPAGVSQWDLPNNNNDPGQNNDNDPGQSNDHDLSQNDDNGPGQHNESNEQDNQSSKKKGRSKSKGPDPAPEDDARQNNNNDPPHPQGGPHLPPGWRMELDPISWRPSYISPTGVWQVDPPDNSNEW